MFKNSSDFVSVIVLAGCCIYAIRIFAWALSGGSDIKKEDKTSLWSLLTSYSDNEDE